MTLVSVDEIRELLGWADVRRVEYPMHDMTCVRVVPARAKLPPIEFAFSGEMEFLQSFGFGEWHCHPEIDAALVMADELIGRRKCVLEERDRGSGRYRGSAIVGPEDVLRTVGSRASVFRRVIFGEDPVEERIDLSRYVQADHGLVLREAAEELRRLYERSGRAMPGWLRGVGE